MYVSKIFQIFEVFRVGLWLEMIMISFCGSYESPQSKIICVQRFSCWCREEHQRLWERSSPLIVFNWEEAQVGPEAQKSAPPGSKILGWFPQRDTSEPDQDGPRWGFCSNILHDSRREEDLWVCIFYPAGCNVSIWDLVGWQNVQCCQSPHHQSDLHYPSQDQGSGSGDSNCILPPPGQEEKDLWPDAGVSQRQNPQRWTQNLPRRFWGWGRQCQSSAGVTI